MTPDGYGFDLFSVPVKFNVNVKESQTRKYIKIYVWDLPLLCVCVVFAVTLRSQEDAENKKETTFFDKITERPRDTTMLSLWNKNLLVFSYDCCRWHGLHFCRKNEGPIPEQLCSVHTNLNINNLAIHLPDANPTKTIRSIFAQKCWVFNKIAPKQVIEYNKFF
jgi:hypothetical protein